ncbi:MAG TPA: site-2 protease family protein [Methylomirabilota bacterium]|jgi:Zn-dependent protease|nr:site-2 protease family protein [Methylomirabilota bacterium]
MRDTFELVRLFGVPIRFHWSWFAVIALITWTLAAGYFPAQLPEASAALSWLSGLMAALLLFGSVLLHELSHAVVARRVGLPVSGITLHVFGGVAQLEREPDSPRSEFLMAVVGPLTSYAVGAACWMALRIAAWPPAGGAILAYLGAVNVLVGTFNLVPGFPLDGGRLLRSALWAWRGDLGWATRIAGQAGSGFAFVLMAWGGLQLATGEVIGGAWLILIGLFLHQAASASYAQLVARRSLERVPVHDVMARRVVTVPAGAMLDQLVDTYFWSHHVTSFPVTESARDGDGVLGIVTINHVKAVPQEEWPSTAVRDVMIGLSHELSIAPSASCWEALGKLTRNGVGRLVVLHANRLVGYLSVRDVLHVLTLQVARGDTVVPLGRGGARRVLDRAA